jgi:hypothetical protein
VELREAIHVAIALGSAPLLEKVKAHDDRALAAGWPKAVGNDLADSWAKRAAASPDGPRWAPDFARFGDPMELVDASGTVVLDAAASFQSTWWLRQQRALLGRRAFLALLYPMALELDWSASCVIFRRPTVSGGAFVHPARPSVVKWIARCRAGCLASRDRLLRHGMESDASPGCHFCSAPLEDDSHMLAGCTGTGSADWAITLQEIWLSVAAALSLSSPPPTDWLAAHHLPLLVALIPVSIRTFLPPQAAPQFARRLHLALAASTAERLWRREALRLPSAPAAAAQPLLHRPCPLPPERQLSPATLRRLEVDRRATATQPSPVVPARAQAPPVSGEPRRRWLRDRLLTVLASETTVVAPNLGATALELTELFERITAETFTDTPGVQLTSRVRALAKVMGNLTRAGEGVPPLLAGRRRDLVCWSRVPRGSVDVAAWRRRVEAAEQFTTRPVRRHLQMAEVDATLAEWVRTHPHMRPAELDDGESGMALLILWEIDHDCAWPSQAAEADRTGVLLGFTRRLKRRVAADEVLSQWLQSADVQRPLCFGLADTHHTRWSLQIRRPPAGGGPGLVDGVHVALALLLGDPATPAPTTAGPGCSSVPHPRGWSVPVPRWRHTPGGRDRTRPGPCGSTADAAVPACPGTEASPACFTPTTEPSPEGPSRSAYCGALAGGPLCASS